MKKRPVAVVLSLAFLAPAPFLAGCQNPDNDKWLGAGVGAAAGALAGRAVSGKKNKTAGTIIGAVVGGVAGYAIAGGFGSKATPEQKANPQFQKANDEFDAGVEAKNAGNDEAALAHYGNAAQLAPDQPESYNNAGLIYLEQGDKQRAEASFRQALQVDPYYEPAKTNLQKMGVSV